jgi:hypothetical protein
VFDRALNYIQALGYDGPVALSCDDSKLVPALRTYWDPQKECFLVVGGVEEPLAVADIEELQAVLKENPPEKGDKVCVRLIPAYMYSDPALSSASGS